MFDNGVAASVQQFIAAVVAKAAFAHSSNVKTQSQLTNLDATCQIKAVYSAVLKYYAFR